MQHQNPPYSVLDLLGTDRVTPATRKALLTRLSEPPVTNPQFFTEAEFGRLQRVCARLMPQAETDSIDLAGPIDGRLAGKNTNGWRYDDLPNDGDAYRLFLAGIDQTAQVLFNLSFDTITPDEQDAVLRAVQQGEPSGDLWVGFAADRFFEELLAEVVEVYYSHPVAQQRIGYTGMADQRVV
ncbi:gluconate 2-dehydrogenase subunit 3 family protein [Rudanella paleaurantiibacter]|uniref:Gluconate 2-dehydrogenase subunit 3 family protein n=1 Tax=Rudanella paleaurantiibacter TaxID=2614655 RepID=A0A7J5TXK3_9BACT|nr:gluconate 2-dehydrogenase subunit 3 family protein [Rudanella paleaurantiibacter]KAB7729375.1 gluconate 2-dehydrogenase subunit 3 family protein [Rudanella paleaurantiibacter]